MMIEAAVEEANMQLREENEKAKKPKEELTDSSHRKKELTMSGKYRQLVEEYEKAKL